MQSIKPKPHTVYLGSWSASTSPARSPSPLRYAHGHHRGKQSHFSPTYGTTSLCQRSRSPSPARLQEMRERGRLADKFGTIYTFFFKKKEGKEKEKKMRMKFKK